MKKHIIISGVHKSGTTSLFNYLSAHPEICGSVKKEIHFFTPLRYGQEIQNISNYFNYFKHANKNDKYLLEASPSYLYGGEKIKKAIEDNLGEQKIIFVLRNPVNRFISFYRHCEGKFIIPRGTDFESFLKENLKNLKEKDKDSPFYRGIREGMYYEYLLEWEFFKKNNIKIVFFENLISDPHNEMRKICKWLNLDDEFYLNYNFPISNKSFRYSNETVHKIMANINMKFEFFFSKAPLLKSFLKKVYVKFNSTNENQITDSQKEELRSIYKPSVENLKKMFENNNDLPNWLK